MQTASALVGACVEQCRPCQASLADKVLAGDRLVVASLAGTVYSLLPSPGTMCSPATRRFHSTAHDTGSPGYGPAVLAAVEKLSQEDVEALLEDTLDLWAAAAPSHRRWPRRRGTPTATPQRAGPPTVRHPTRSPEPRGESGLLARGFVPPLATWGPVKELRALSGGPARRAAGTSYQGSR
ncbi:hypothetical protein [Streptomyces sp. NPDC057428]|uniref:hypothetical protein n=1 Tax=Streptomyces sp. NPDC057428 TaxID=3346129 RepID=UPI00367CD855